MSKPSCFFEGWHGAGSCSGRLVRAHLCKQQVLEREGHPGAVQDPRSWIPVCGGIGYGNAGHHGQMDHSRSLRIGIEQLPTGFLELMAELGMTWYVVKHFQRSRSERLARTR